MRSEIFTIILAATSVAAQKVVGTAYGFGAGATGGGSATAVTPTTNAELAAYLSDDVARVILLTKTFDFTGTTATSAGCDRISCKSTAGGQLYLGTLSCNGADEVAVSSIKYDTGGSSALVVGSNKSILGVGAKGALKGKGLSIKKNAVNIIIQGVEFTTINPGIVWGGDALDFQGGNSKVWVDHNKFSLIGRMFIVSHYDGASATLSNNEFNGVTTTSATCNGNHYWGLMMIGAAEKFTLDKNYFHNQSGRAPKLGQDGVSGYFHAVNNYFENMKGHAFDAYTGANALVEGNAFVAVTYPATDHAATVGTFVTNAGSACSSPLGRACLANSVDSASGKLTGGSTTSFISTLKAVDVPSRLDASKVAAYVKANAGPAKLGAASAVVDAAPVASTAKPATTTIKAATTTTKAATTITKAATTTTAAAAAAVAQLYAQCGGQGFTGPTKCASPATCVKANDYYSQCINSSSKFRRVLRFAWW